ncbi:hypothetical protein FHS61_000416 [Altererythrobacter atlanticus]|uniref:Uncharacterized protein n=2 Tax=Croceibacterium atlanticum TaxID=1267766 RepID=A0A0F7KU13_9SPHN|nr:hypothetical protein [Croceibacterium atlanticum]AKH42646.1 hypothetical protein WYH_01610 [Croceibacterium atlanticum]MBB5731423.1 hypothetical protein [Croceibacterium atlanticum]
MVTTGTGEIAGQGANGGFTRDWEAIRANGDIQFSPVEIPPPPETPEWLKWLGELLSPLGEGLTALGRALGLSGPALLWILATIGAALAALLIWRLASSAMRRKSGQAARAEPDWTPDAHQALGLLEDADRLAAQGHYDEAAHLLLRRSVAQIEAARPGLLEPSSTAREIAALPALPDRARQAFGTIAECVERSLFALRNLSAEDWQKARAAYADFALADQGAGS